MLDIVFPTHNRREMVQASFEALRENTNWTLVDRLHIADDRSTDGTHDYLAMELRHFPFPARLTSQRFGGSVNGLLDAGAHTRADIIAKIDSDVIVCPGWLDQMLTVMREHPSLDCLGMEPGFGGDVAPLDAPRTFEAAKWIGGVGLIRPDVFRRGRLRQNDRFFGWTAFQKRLCNSGWITPALPVFLLDLLPFEPWVSLTESYIEKGWQRPLHREPGRYDQSMSGFWEWWLESDAVRKMGTAAL